MAIYEYRCADCGYEFTLRLSFAEHDRAAVRCPVCGSAEVVQKISAVSVRTSEAPPRYLVGFFHDLLVAAGVVDYHSRERILFMNLRSSNTNGVIATYNRSRHVVPMSGPDTAIFSQAVTEVCYGWDRKVKMRLPIFTGALGSTEIARKHWREFATEEGVFKVLAMGCPACPGRLSGKGRADSG